MADDLNDTPEYLTAWAGKLAEACTAAELRLLHGDYRKRAGNKRLSKSDREGNRLRAKALKKHL